MIHITDAEIELVKAGTPVVIDGKNMGRTVVTFANGKFFAISDRAELECDEFNIRLVRF